MKREAIDCDFCEQQDINNAIDICIIEDRKMDAAGSMDDDYQYFNCCKDCSKEVIKILLKNINHQRNYTENQKTIKQLQNLHWSIHAEKI